MRLSIRFDMRNIGPGSDAQLYRMALEQAEWADANGFDTVYIGEHHGADDGYIPSPIVLAGGIAARTNRIEIHLSALLLPLHDPIRLAEDLAILDIMCEGRLSVTFGMGYRPHEFAMFGVPPQRLATIFEQKLAVVLEAWSGGSFSYRDTAVKVRPRPAQRPRPKVYVGGSGPASARRAARLGLGYRPAVAELWDVYTSELGRLGRTDEDVPPDVTRTVFVVDDPRASWSVMGDYLLHTNNSYASWAQERGSGRSGWRHYDSADELRSAGQFLVCTPAECLREVRMLGSHGELQLQPAMGGLPAEVAWSMLALFGESVLPHLERHTVRTAAPVAVADAVR